MLNIYLDFKSPGAYLAMRPTLALLERLNQSANTKWLPYNTMQQRIPPKREDENKGERHRRVRALARQNTHLLYADIQGVPMSFSEIPGNTDLALAALLFVQEDPLRFIHAAFAAYWAQQRDLNNAQVVAELLQAQGYEADKFDAERALQNLKEHQSQTEEQGVVDAPAYVLHEQMFIGREHLPWVEELLTQSG